MKLRLRHNSIRLRLSRSEVKLFLEKGFVEESIAFGAQGGSLMYRLVSEPRAGHVTARFESDCISVLVPDGVAEEWALGESVGIEHSQPLDEGDSLRILIEKDFACLEPRSGDDDLDAFAHPGSIVNGCGPN